MLKKLIQRKFCTLCYSRLIAPDTSGHTYASALHILHLRTSHGRRNQLVAVFVVNVSLFLYILSTSTNIIGLRVPTRKLRDFPVLHVSPFYINCPFAMCATAAVSVCSDVDVFRGQTVTFRFDINLLKPSGNFTYDQV
jgi:hypothetical protein